MRRRAVGIVGYGRFGKFWAEFLAPHHQVWVTDQNAFDAPHFLPVPELCARVDALFLCVPINQIEAAARALLPHLRPGMTVLDTCSVKSYPARALITALAGAPELTLIATHPLFGPDSAAGGTAGLPMAIWRLSGKEQTYREWAAYFERAGLRVIEISPEDHDRLAAYTQGVAHFIGRVLGELDLQPTPLDTRGFKALLNLVEQTCRDSWELFRDLQRFNPYTREMRLRLLDAVQQVDAALLPERAAPGEWVIGLQGGRGSFSELACRAYCRPRAQTFASYRVEYLHTAENVLAALHRGELDFGVVAIQNARAGVVMETLHALSRYRCEIVDTFPILADHCLLIHPQVDFAQVDAVLSHPQALAQCAATLTAKYPHLQPISGTGELIDQALCAQRLAEGKLPPSHAVLAPRACASLYGLVIQDESLQDLGDANLTTFAWIRRL